MDDVYWIPKEIDQHVYNFDVSKRGEYLGMPEIEETLLAGYKDGQIDHKQMSPQEKLAYAVMIDRKMKSIW